MLIRRWSRQEGWDQRHVFALAAGAIAGVLLLVAVRKVNPNQR